MGKKKKKNLNDYHDNLFIFSHKLLFPSRKERKKGEKKENKGGKRGGGNGERLSSPPPPSSLLLLPFPLSSLSSRFHRPAYRTADSSNSCSNSERSLRTQTWWRGEEKRGEVGKLRERGIERVRMSEREREGEGERD